MPRTKTGAGPAAVITLAALLAGCGDGSTRVVTRVVPAPKPRTPAPTPSPAPAPVAPTITGITPSEGPLAGGTPVVLSGSGLTGATTITIGDAPLANVVVQSDTTIIGDTGPTRTVGRVAVGVVTPGGAATLSAAFDYRLGLSPGPATVVVSDPAVALVVGDADGDAAPDLFVTSRVGRVEVLHGDGAGGVGAITTVALAGHDTFGLDVGDLDSDGDDDLVVTDIANHQVLVVHGDGAGDFTLAGPVIGGVSAFPENPSLGDLNGDGRLDVAIPIFNSPTGTSPGLVRVLLGDGAGHFTTPGQSLGVLNGPQHSATGDVDGDGDLDVVVNDLHSASVSVLINDGAGAFTIEHAPVGSQPGGVITGDFTGDGHDDVIVLCNNDLPALIDRAANGRWNLRFIALTGSFHILGAAGDLNRDGHLDVVAARFAGAPARDLSILLGDGRGGFVHHLATTPDVVQNVALADLDGDGRLDVATLGGTPPVVTIFLNR